MEERDEQQLQEARGALSEAAAERPYHRVRAWFEQSAPLIRWDVFDSPLGPFYVAAGEKGIVQTAFGESRKAFFSRLDPRARIERDAAALAPVTARLRAYFENPSLPLDLPVDLSDAPPFQRLVLQTIRRIPAGTVWTYQQVAEALGRPTASRAVGQALAHNPTPIVIPCHRVVGSDGSLTGYGGSGGIATKRWLLQHEGAL